MQLALGSSALFHCLEISFSQFFGYKWAHIIPCLAFNAFYVCTNVSLLNDGETHTNESTIYVLISKSTYRLLHLVSRFAVRFKFVFFFSSSLASIRSIHRHRSTVFVCRAVCSTRQKIRKKKQNEYRSERQQRTANTNCIMMVVYSIRVYLLHTKCLKWIATRRTYGVAHRLLSIFFSS